jgi:Sec7-like guanine-nucleotide exchange factor
VLETGGEGLASVPGVVHVCQAEVCRSLVANARSPDAPVLALVLRTIYSMFAASSSLKQHLKVQMEVFLTSVHLYLADSRGAPNVQRELALESLVEFTRENGLMLDLYCNFDCDISCANLFELLMAKSTAPFGGAIRQKVRRLLVVSILKSSATFQPLIRSEVRLLFATRKVAKFSSHDQFGRCLVVGVETP